MTYKTGERIIYIHHSFSACHFEARLQVIDLTTFSYTTISKQILRCIMEPIGKVIEQCNRS